MRDEQRKATRLVRETRIKSLKFQHISLNKMMNAYLEYAEVFLTCEDEINLLNNLCETQHI